MKIDFSSYIISIENYVAKKVDVQNLATAFANARKPRNNG